MTFKELREARIKTSTPTITIDATISSAAGGGLLAAVAAHDDKTVTKDSVHRFRRIYSVYWLFNNDMKLLFKEADELFISANTKYIFATFYHFMPRGRTPMIMMEIDNTNQGVEYVQRLIGWADQYHVKVIM